jgi:hypothetical protein
METRPEKWERWLVAICDEVYRLTTNHHVFHRIRRFAQENPAFATKGALLTNVFWSFLHETFIHYAAVAVRRQCEVDKQVISLARLLDDLAQEPELIRRTEFVEAHTIPLSTGSEQTRLQAEAFFEKFAPGGAPTVDSYVVLMDLAELHLAAEEITRFAHRRVAHYDKRETPFIGDLTDVDEPIHCIGRTLVRYHYLVTGREFDVGISAVVDPHLELLFRDPWKMFEP